MSKTQVINVRILFTAAIFLQICNGASVLGSEIDVNYVMPQSQSQSQRVCSKSIEDCFTDAELMESESSRRVLVMQKKYISYDTLRRDMVPCDKPGASYYECHSGQANSYNRGCQIITRCARGIKNWLHIWYFRFMFWAFGLLLHVLLSGFVLLLWLSCVRTCCIFIFICYLYNASLWEFVDDVGL